MCGIVGIVEPEGSRIDDNLLMQMNNELVHRGPDEDGYFIEENVGLAMRRLRIIDLKGGSQPIYNEDRSVAVVFNGEIYNYVELRDELQTLGHRFYTNTDTEVIVHSYEQWGLDRALARFQGMFAFALFDLSRHLLYIARDRFGIKPLYYSHNGGRLLFASEIKALLKDRRVARIVDPVAVSHYLSLGYMPTPYTGFKTIQKLRPAHYIRYDCRAGELSEIRYWRLVPQETKATFSELEEEFEYIFKDTIRIMLRSDVPIGVFLSSGLDSGAITAFIAKYFNSRIDTYTARFGEASYNEAPLAKLVAQRYGTTHHEIDIEAHPERIVEDLVYAFDEPNADYGAIPLYYICNEAKKYLRVVFAGNGGDEVFAGYPHLLAHNFAKIYSMLPKFIRSKLVEPLIWKLPASYSKGSFEHRAKRFIRGVNAKPPDAHFLWKGIMFDEEKQQLFEKGLLPELVKEPSVHIFEQYYEELGQGQVSEIWKLMNIDLNTFLLDDNIAVADRIMMLHSLEGRVPFLDHKIVEFASKLPARFLIRGFNTKYFLRRVLKKYLPREIIFQKKKGFTPPMPVWLRGELKSFMFDVLSPKNIKASGLFRFSAVKQLMEEHISGRSNNARELWSLIMLILWQQRWGVGF